MNTKLTKLFFINAILCLLFISIQVESNTKIDVSFSKCIDGDTASFILESEVIKVRFLAIDTKETVHPTKDSEYDGELASKYTCERIMKAQKIELEYDSGSSKTDKYNRHLAWIWVDDSLLQKELISLGYAKVEYIYGNYLYTDELYELEHTAKDNKVGIWSEYVPAVYTVTFDEGEQIKEVQITENELVESYIPVKKGYTFISWQENNKSFDFNRHITKDITLIANFQKEYSLIDGIILLLVLSLLFMTNKKAFKKKLKKLF